MAGNKTSRRCWAYQTAVGTEAIDDATDTTYFFGDKDTSDWKVPRILTDVEAYYSYSSREPTLTTLDPKYQTLMTPYYPTTAQDGAWMLKQVTEDGISANVHKNEVLDTGLPLPLTIRFELNDGSVDRLFQAVDAYCIGRTTTLTLNSPALVECEWAFGRLEDKRGQWEFDDTAADITGDVITLTTNGGTLNQYANWGIFINGGTGEDEELVVQSNTAATPTLITTTTTPTAVTGDTLSVWDKPRPKLTTSPVMPGYTASNNYNGTPNVYWDTADQNVNLTECWQVSFQNRQNYQQVLDSDSKYCTTYLYKHEPITLTLDMVCERHKQVYDYIDRKANTVSATIYKPNSTYYRKYIFTGSEIVDWVETGHANKGHYNAKVLMKAASMIEHFTLEAETNWSTHYKHVA